MKKNSFTIRAYRQMNAQPTRHRILRSWLALAFKDKNPRTVLDWSCGCGIGVELLRESFPHWNALMTDISDTRDHAQDAPFYLMDPDTPRLEIEDASVDVVVCSEVLEHVHNLTATMREIHRVLKPGGILVGSIPNFRHLAAKMSFLTNQNYRLGGRFENGLHVNLITPQFLSNFLRDIFTLERRGGDIDWLSWVDFWPGKSAREAYAKIEFRGLHRENRRFNALSYDFLFQFRKKPHA